MRWKFGGGEGAPSKVPPVRALGMPCVACIARYPTSGCPTSPDPWQPHQFGACHLASCRETGQWGLTRQRWIIFAIFLHGPASGRRRGVWANDEHGWDGLRPDRGSSSLWASLFVTFPHTRWWACVCVASHTPSRSRTSSSSPGRRRGTTQLGALYREPSRAG
jgi:hypothetical protein